jgi:hypothetical protein
MYLWVHQFFDLRAILGCIGLDFVVFTFDYHVYCQK